MRTLLNALIITSCLSLCACSTTQDELTEKALSHTINIDIVDAQSFEMIRNATCIISGQNDHDYKMTKNPGQIILPSWEDHVYISCQASDYYQEQIAISNTLAKWTYKDLAFLPSNVVIFDPYDPDFRAKYIVVFMSHDLPPSKTKSQEQFEKEQKTETIFQGKLSEPS